MTAASTGGGCFLGNSAAETFDQGLDGLGLVDLILQGWIVLAGLFVEQAQDLLASVVGAGGEPDRFTQPVAMDGGGLPEAEIVPEGLEILIFEPSLPERMGLVVEIHDLLLPLCFLLLFGDLF